MKRILYIVFILICSVFVACKKEVDTDNYPYESINFQNEVAAIYQDANALMSFYTDEAADTPCNIVEILDSADLYKKSFVFNGQSCNGNLNRVGTIHVQLLNATQWFSDGAQLKITFDNFTLTSSAGSGESLIIDGSRIISNLSGATKMEDLAPGGAGIQRQLSSQNMTVTYPNGSQRIWNESHLITTFKNADWEFEFYMDGNATGLPYSNVCNWGVDRTGENFYTVVTEVMKSKLCNGIWKQGPGKTTIYNTSSPATVVEYGVDNTGAPASDACFAYGINVIWTDEEGIVHVTTKPYN